MTPKFILASNSPRRRDLLSMLGMDFRVIVSECDEAVEAGTLPEDTVRELAKRKGTAVLDTLGILPQNTYIIAADTVVSDGSRILGKPSDKDDARNTFRSLSDRTHSVWTGIAVIGYNNGQVKVCTDAVETKVVFGNISDEEAAYYAKTGEPLDKAGSYAIQGLGGFYVTELHGDYYNVVGLPIARLRRVLFEEFGLDSHSYIGKKQRTAE